MKKEEIKNIVESLERSCQLSGSPLSFVRCSFRDSENAKEMHISCFPNLIDSNKLETYFKLVKLNTDEKKEYPEFDISVHSKIYELVPEAKCIVHAHGVYPVAFSQSCGENIIFEGFEVQTAFEGQTTHQDVVEIPIFDNTQSAADLNKKLTKQKKDLSFHALILRKHGTFTWGTDFEAALKHSEAINYLCQVKFMSKF